MSDQEPSFLYRAATALEDADEYTLREVSRMIRERRRAMALADVDAAVSALLQEHVWVDLYAAQDAPEVARRRLSMDAGTIATLRGGGGWVWDVGQSAMSVESIAVCVLPPLSAPRSRFAP